MLNPAPTRAPNLVPRALGEKPGAIGAEYETCLTGGVAVIFALVPRFLYDCRILGPSSFEFQNKRCLRHDLVLRNARGLRLHCSHWRFTDEKKRPCVVFMHANSASRVQACSYLPVALSLGATLFALDCGGSGVSDGAHVSLGWHEADDLRIVLLHQRRRSDVGSLIVWGHSMGAAAVIYYQGRYLTKKNVTAPRLDACVCFYIAHHQ